jgi:serine/threonine protein kinase
MSTVFKPDQTRYELERKLGEGLNSTVWRATRFDFSGENPHAIALKLPKDQTSVPFLRREYEILQRVNSVHVVRVMAWESFGGEPALALEWIDGVTLTELAQRKTLDAAARDEIIRQVHVGLADVAKSGACHGDLHPGNIMIDREGRAILIDFASGKTPEGVLQATPAFVSPEIWQGAGFSHASDLFALKVIREHLLSGFRRLPPCTEAAKDFKVTKENPQARKEIAQAVVSLLAQSHAGGTQLLDIDTSRERAPSLEKSSRNLALVSAAPYLHPYLTRVACVLALALTLHIPVFADDPPPEPPGSGQIVVTSRKWMQIKLNGEEAGYAPVKLRGLKVGIQHLEWKSAISRGEYRFKMRAGDTVRLVENADGRLVKVR